MELTKDALAALLKEAEAAHAAYEETRGTHDEAWAEWYASYIVGKLREGYER